MASPMDYLGALLGIGGYGGGGGGLWQQYGQPQYDTDWGAVPLRGSYDYAPPTYRDYGFSNSYYSPPQTWQPEPHWFQFYQTPYMGQGFWNPYTLPLDPNPFWQQPFGGRVW